MLRKQTPKDRASVQKETGVVGEVVLHETCDEIIRMVVTLLHAEVKRLSRFLASLGEQVGLQLSFQKFVRRALVDQDFAGNPAPPLISAVASWSSQVLRSGPR